MRLAAPLALIGCLVVTGCTRVIPPPEEVVRDAAHAGEVAWNGVVEQVTRFWSQEQEQTHSSLATQDTPPPQEAVQPVVPVLPFIPVPETLQSSSSVASSVQPAMQHVPEVVWLKYRNAEFVYSLKYVGTVVQEGPDYIRMQNYDVAPDRFVLTPKDYYLEIAILRAENAPAETLLCTAEKFPEAKVTVGAETGYLSSMVIGEMRKSVLCVPRNGATLLFTVTELPHAVMPFGTTILSSVHFQLP